MKQILSLVVGLFVTVNIFAQHQLKIEENRFVKNINGKSGVTDSVNAVIIPFVYDWIEYKNARLIISKKDFQGLLSINNKVVVPVQYRFILPRKNDRFILWTPSSLFGLCDIDGKIILPVKYRNVYSIQDADFYITTNERKLNGVYDYNGKNILPEIYKFYTIDNFKVFAEKDNESLILDLQQPEAKIYLNTGITLIETIQHYTVAEKFYQIVKKQNKYGIMNSENQVVIPIIYDEVKSSQHWRYFLIKMNDKIGIINVNGQIEKEPIYDNVELRKEFILLKRKSQKDESFSYKW